ncbi:MAG: RagB/SusD family nutrient uptake outer membrane protein, partial [Marinobacter sp.]
MKTNILIAFSLLISFSFVSCEDFLEETNKSGLTSNPYYNSPEGVESLVNACYTPLRYWYGREEATNFTVTSTDILTKAAGHTNTPVNDYSSDFKADNGGLNNLWAWNYKAFNFCNTALARMDEVEMENKAVLQGEVSFLRAFYYWHIVEMWGKTHFSVDESQGVITTAEATEVDVIYNQILDDLDVAIANCPDVKERGGRITSLTAQAFKARILLTRGKNVEAANLAKEVINSGQFQLFDDYKALWDMSNSEGSSNSEVIWYV